MTPKEKAKELLDKFSDNVSVYYTENSVPCMLNAPMIIKQRKKFALIIVDKIVKSLTNYGKDSNELQNMDREFNYWDKVKQEIEKL